MTPARTPAAPHKRSQRAKRPPVATEHQEQSALFEWRELMAVQIPELNLLFAVPNAGKRNPAEAQWMKSEGLRAVVPDVWLPVPRMHWHGMVIEMKREDGGSGESPEQEWWRYALEKQGYLAIVCHGWDDARKEILDYLEGQ